ncbi:hypothetical protein ILYODFUR_008869 [Ilyodon furcidens]|uniref:Uncharacterized protein n=1 Tax=Ilyodon furcidens TaxID=33524 RepID=A0ABV0T6H4_9TELE
MPQKSGEEIGVGLTTPEMLFLRFSPGGSFKSLHPCLELPIHPVWFSFTAVIIIPTCHTAEIRSGRGPTPIYSVQSNECLRTKTATQQLHKKEGKQLELSCES